MKATARELATLCLDASLREARLTRWGYIRWLWQLESTARRLLSALEQEQADGKATEVGGVGPR